MKREQGTAYYGLTMSNVVPHDKVQWAMRLLDAANECPKHGRLPHDAWKTPACDCWRDHPFLVEPPENGNGAAP